MTKTAFSKFYRISNVLYNRTYVLLYNLLNPDTYVMYFRNNCERIDYKRTHFYSKQNLIGVELCSAMLLSLDKERKNWCKLFYFSGGEISMIFYDTIKQTTWPFIIRSISNKLAWEKQSGQFIGQYPFYIRSRRLCLKGLNSYMSQQQNNFRRRFPYFSSGSC